MAAHPTFASGHCFMVETLNKQECELVGEVLHEHLRRQMPFMGKDFEFEVKRINRILQKIDYATFDVAHPKRKAV